MEIKPESDPMCPILFTKWANIIEKHKAPGVEIEMRLGRTAGRGFDTNVGSAVFSKVLESLGRYTGWEETRHTNSTIYYFSDNKRLTIDEKTDEQLGQIKKRICVDDFALDTAPLDIRLGVSSEEPFEYDGEETSTEQKTKERWSFVRKNLSIDMTIVKGNPDDKDCDDDTNYQIELEIIDPTKIQNKIEIYNILHKVFDIMKLIAV